MVIVKIQAGLGNQMFEYAMSKWLEYYGVEVKLDIHSYNLGNKGVADVIHNGYELERIFNINANYATFDEAQKYGSVERDYFHRLFRKVFGVKKTHIKRTNLGSRRWYFPELKNLDNVYLDGYWCTFKYSDDIADIIRKEFSFAISLDERNACIAQQMAATNSVSIHVRHGDYLKLSDWCHVLTEDYYNRAIEKINNQVNGPVYYCFSDDIAWCREHIKAEKIVFIDWNQGEDSYRDMQLMSLCKHNIIANSTFSMWGAWLNENKEKIVIQPRDVFINPQDACVDMMPDNWTTLDN